MNAMGTTMKDLEAARNQAAADRSKLLTQRDEAKKLREQRYATESRRVSEDESVAAEFSQKLSAARAAPSDDSKRKAYEDAKYRRELSADARAEATDARQAADAKLAAIDGYIEDANARVAAAERAIEAERARIELEALGTSASLSNYFEVIDPHAVGYAEAILAVLTKSQIIQSEHARLAADAKTYAARTGETIPEVDMSQACLAIHEALLERGYVLGSTCALDPANPGEMVKAIAHVLLYPPSPPEVLELERRRLSVYREHRTSTSAHYAHVAAEKAREQEIGAGRAPGPVVKSWPKGNFGTGKTF